MTIYFDKDSTIGHPSPERWVPLEYVNGIRSDRQHYCPKRKTDGRTTSAAATTTSTTAPLLQEEPDLEKQVIQLMKELISKMELLIRQK